ncbi:MAG TPA: hypothetical protein DCM21_01085 [Butyrivibrio sp.]|nr:hypothetical protein [Butyrivibrio sp.]
MSKRRSESVDSQQLPKGYSVNDIVFDTKDVSIVSIDKNGTLTVNKEDYTILYEKLLMVNIR